MDAYGNAIGAGQLRGATAPREFSNVANDLNQQIASEASRLRELAERVHLVANDTVGMPDNPTKAGVESPRAVATNTRDWINELSNQIHALEHAISRLDRV